MFDLLHGNVGFDVADAPDASKFLHAKAAIGFEIICDDFQKEIALPRQHITLDDLGQFHDVFSEDGNRVHVRSRR